MTRLILARHGNTFGPQEKPVWVGARTDLPLVDTGIAQAHILAAAMQDAHIIPDLIVTGPLKRTLQTAHIVAEKLGLSAPAITTDLRLTEIDYGAWEGLSTEAIEQSGSGPELTAWNSRSVFPSSPGWRPRETEIEANIKAILSEIETQNTLIVTSNGILRFFVRIAVNRDDIGNYKVATGNICIMQKTGERWHIRRWNQSPDILKE